MRVLHMPAFCLFLVMARLLPAWEWAGIVHDGDSLALGEPVTLSMSVRAAAEEEIRWPLPGREALGGWRLLGSDSLVETPAGDARLVTRVLRLARYRLGDAPLPVYGPLLEGRPAQGDTLRLEILTTLPDSAAPADILDPERMRHAVGWWLLRGALVLALLAAGWLGLRWWRRRRSVVRETPTLPADPWRDFLARMSRIEDQGLWRTGQVDVHYAELSLALRGLLEDCLDLPCRERSTSELRDLLRDGLLDEGEQVELFRLLEENDWIKYARQWPDAQTCARQVERYQKWALTRKERLLQRHRQLQAAASVEAAAGGEGGA